MAASGRTEGISPGASCGRGPASQPAPQSPALAPKCTCGDPGGPGSDTRPGGSQGKEGGPRAWGQSPPGHSRVPSWNQEAVIGGQAQVLFPHRHHRGALLGKRSRTMGMEACPGVPESPWQGGPGSHSRLWESKAQEQPGPRGQERVPPRQGPHLPTATATHPHPVLGPRCCLVHGRSPGRKRHGSFSCFCPTQEMALNLAPGL